MYCMECGKALPDDANFCLRCGTPQGARESSVSTAPRHKEVSILINVKVDARGWYPGGGIVLKPEFEKLIDQIIVTAVQEFATDGWRPDHGYTFRQLSGDGLVDYEDIKPRFKFSAGQEYFIESVRIRMSR